MSSWNTGKIVVNGVRFHYTRTGGKKPAVVLAHGFSDAGLCWTPVAQALAADYDLVMVDARGHGFSDAPETGYTLTEMASDLQGVITGLGLVRPAIVGHSMGGGTTLALAGLYPDVPGAIILEDAAALSAADFPISKRGNSLRVMAEALRWGKRGARVNTISPGIIMTPLAKDELSGPRGEGYRPMLGASAAGRAGAPDEVANVAALLMGPDGGFITGSDFLMDGGVTAAYWYGDLAEVRAQ